MSEDEATAAWWRAVQADADDRVAALHDAYQQLENNGWISKVKVHGYLCARRGCVLATVLRIDGVTIVRIRDYKLPKATNIARSVESARRKNTLNGNDHWPGHTFDVTELATWGPDAGMDMNCRCRNRRLIKAVDILAICEGVRPGHPGPPTRF